MAQKAKVKVLQKFEVGSEELEAFLGSAYGMDKEEAEVILTAYKTNPLSVTPQERKNARAFLAALKTKPIAISEKPAWKPVKKEGE